MARAIFHAFGEEEIQSPTTRSVSCETRFEFDPKRRREFYFNYGDYFDPRKEKREGRFNAE